MSRQAANGWLADCCLNDPARPLTHTLGYALRGLVEAHRHRPNPAVLQAAVKLAEPLTRCLRPDGFLAGRFAADWTPQGELELPHGGSADCSELVRSVRVDQRARVLRCGDSVRTRFVRRTVCLDPPTQRLRRRQGLVSVDGDYGRFEYLNWARSSSSTPTSASSKSRRIKLPRAGERGAAHWPLHKRGRSEPTHWGL
jgi:hypothetical protein